jgi:hypothetical protein
MSPEEAIRIVENYAPRELINEIDPRVYMELAKVIKGTLPVEES